MREDREAKAGSRAGRGPWAVAEALAAHVEGGQVHPEGPDLSDEEQAELASLLYIADRLDAQMEPRRPSPAFVRSLGEELEREAEQCMARRKRRHRVAVISAAVAGGIVSVASLVGGVVVLVKWLRTRTEARQASTA